MDRRPMINQLDVEERNSQAGIMKSIYEKAIATIIRLDPDTEGSDLALQSIRDCHTAWIGRTKQPRDIPVRKESEEECTFQAKNEILGPNSRERLTSIGRLMFRYWWLRAWVV
jgi:hypothetical protein